MNLVASCQSCGREIGDDNPTGVCDHCIAGLLSCDEEPNATRTKGVSPPAPESRIAQYQLRRLIAQGGMGAVYEAFDTTLQTTVALKRMHDSMTWSPASVMRFQEEAAAAAELSHPNIVPIIEAGSDQETPFYTMPLINGPSLAQKGLQKLKADSKRTDAEVIETVERIRKIALAVQHAHSRGILHRDIKPSNILLDESGEPYITDFGLAKRINNDLDLTHTGTMIGTPDYMAPEQISDDLGPVSTATDIFSLGTVLYQQLTGSPPFRAETHVQTFQHILHSDPTTLTKRNEKIDDGLNLICLKCLQKTPSDRYKSAQELADDLTHWIDREPLSVRPETGFEKAFRTIKRYPFHSVASLGLLCWGILFLVYWELSRQEIRKEKEQTERVNQQLQLLVRENRINRAAHLFNQSDSPAAIANLSAIVRDDALSPAQTDSLSYLMSAIETRRFPQQVCPPLPHPKNVGQWAFTPKGDHLVSGSFDGYVRVWDLKSGEAVRAMNHGERVYRISISPSGQHVLSASFENTARIWNIETGEAQSDWMEHDDEIHSAHYSPDGQWIVTSSFDDQIKLWDGTTGEQLPARMEHPEEEIGVHVTHFIPHRNQLLSASVKGIIRIWDLPSGTLRAVIPTGENYLNEILIDPSGRRFVNLAKPTVSSWEIGTWKKEREMEHSLPVWSAQFSHDGERLLTTLQDRTDETRVWDMEQGRINRDLRFRRIRGIGIAKHGLRNNWYSRLKNQIYAWSDQDGHASMPPITLSSSLHGIVTDPNHPQLAALTSDGSIHVWTTPSEEGMDQMYTWQNFTHATVVGPGQLLAWSHERKSFDLLTHTLQPSETVRFPGLTEVDCMIPSKSGRYIAMRTLRNDEWHLCLYDSQSNRWQFYPCTMGELDFVFSENDQFLTFETAPEKAAVLNLANGELMSEALTITKKYSAAAFSPNGTEVFYGHESGEISHWKVGSTNVVEVLNGPWNRITGISHAPNAAQIISSSNDGILIAWRTQGETETQQTWKSPKLGRILKIGYNHKGDQIVTASEDGHLRFWNIENGETARPPLQHDDRVLNFLFSPDDRVLMTVTADHLIHFWNPTSGSPIAESIPWNGKWESITLSASGRHFTRALADSRMELRPTPGHTTNQEAPAWFPGFAEALAGIRLSKNDQPVTIPWTERARVLNEIHALPNEDPITRWAQEILSRNQYVPRTAVSQ